MKHKILFFLFGLLMLAACGNSQQNTGNNNINQKSEKITLKDEVLGVKLGKTSQKDALRILEEQGFPMEHFGRNMFIYEQSISFGGKNWDMLVIQVYNNTVHTLQFVKLYSNSELLQKDYEEFSSILMGKYEPLYFGDGSESMKNYLQFFDEDDTSLYYGKRLFGNKDGLLLEYSDGQLSDEAAQSVYDEL